MPAVKYFGRLGGQERRTEWRKERKRRTREGEVIVIEMGR